MSLDFISEHVKHYKVVYCLLQKIDIGSHITQLDLSFELKVLAKPLGFKAKRKIFGLKIQIRFHSNVRLSQTHENGTGAW